MANARRRSFRSTVQKRKMLWEGAQINGLVTTAAPFIFATVVSEATLENIPDPTIIRIRGDLAVVEKQQGANDSGIVTMGMMVVTAAAFAASAIPDPIVDISSDWMWWDSRALARDVGVLPETALGTFARVSIDNKAMRKVGLNQILIFVIKLTTLAGANVQYNVSGAVRVLLKK